MTGVDQNLEAYQLLLHANQFEELFIGFAAHPSSLVSAFQVIFRDEKNADKIFKDLLENAAMPGKLYALCGLYFTDFTFFQEVVDQYRTCQEVIILQSGCIGYGKPISEIVEVKSPNAIRLSNPDDSLMEWRRTHPEANIADIVGGGYPHMFGKSFQFG